jgi:polyhydroxyalkanoate synthase
MTRSNTQVAPHVSPPRVEETPTQRLDRLVHAAAAPVSGSLSPISLALAMADWAWHLGVSPGRQMELAALATQLTRDALNTQARDEADAAADDDPRFRHEAWGHWPFSQMRAGFRNTEAFWREATRVPGMTAHHADLARFFARQWLGVMAPANWLATNPVVLQDVAQSNGAHLLKGLHNWMADVSGVPTPDDEAPQDRFKVGRRCGRHARQGGAPQPPGRADPLRRRRPTKVHPEPMFIMPSWIMKYYILDLSPHNSMVRYLVSQGHTVYMLSWRNPDASDHDLTMDDYLKLGVLDVLQAIGHLQDKPTTHRCTPWATAWAARCWPSPRQRWRRRGRHGGRATPTCRRRKTLTLAGRADRLLGTRASWACSSTRARSDLLDHITKGQGYLSGKQMAGSFQFLHSRDLVWTRRMREYLMGERDQGNDLMAWNADTTRMPARMHHEYLTSLYLNNALANGSYRVDGRAVSLGDLHLPVFLVGTERDHVSPWRSVYKLHHHRATPRSPSC